jgi:hypothetical protein
LETNERFIDSIISFANSPVNVTDISVVNVHVDELSSARIWEHKLCATFSASLNINYRLPIKVYYRICTLRHIRNGINIEKDKWKVISIKCWNNKILCKQHSDWKSLYRNILDNKVVKIICFCFEHQTKTLIMESLSAYRVHT